MSLSGICTTIATVLSDPASGIALSLADPPESIGDQVTSIPFISAERESMVALGNGSTMWTHAIDLMVFVSPRVGNLQEEYQRVKPLVHSVIATLHAGYLSGAFGAGVSRCIITSYRGGQREYPAGGQAYHTITFAVEAKEHTTP